LAKFSQYAGLEPEGRIFPVLRIPVLLSTTLMVGACVVEDDAADDQAQSSQPAPAPQAPSTPPIQPLPDSSGGLHFIVDISDRKLYVVRGQDTVRTEPVAVGMEDHPTPTGEWKLHRVDWNPDWTPPPGQEWTEDKEPQPPGSPQNPMGRARLVFQMPYTIHGTKENASLGKAVSHGSIRVANAAVVELGRMLMDAAGAQKPESFYQDVAAKRKEMRQVDLPNPVPITVRP
jgi:murein L,D-transpeptidase YcbB/YkuD